MKQLSYGLVLALTALIAVPTGIQASKKPSSKKTSWADTIVSPGGLITVSALGGATYLASQNQTVHDTVKPFYDSTVARVQPYYDSTKQWVTDNPRTAGYGALAAAAGLYLGYRWMSTPGREPMSIPQANPALLGRFKNDKSISSGDREVEEGTVAVPEWLKCVDVLLAQAYAGLSEPARGEMIKKYVFMAAEDPHYLVYEDAFIRRLTYAQKETLFGIFSNYCVDHLEKVINEVLKGLSSEQDGVKLIIESAGNDPLVQINVLRMLVEDTCLETVQAQFVKEQLTYLNACGTMQQAFIERQKLTKKSDFSHQLSAKLIEKN